MSVDLEPSIISAGLDPRVFVTTGKYPGSVWFTTGYLRTEGLMVGYDPIPENPHHGEVWGVDRKKRHLHRTSRGFVQIPGVDLQ